MEALEDIIEAFPEFLTDEPINGGDLVDFVGDMITRYQENRPRPIGKDRPEGQSSIINAEVSDYRCIPIGEDRPEVEASDVEVKPQIGHPPKVSDIEMIEVRNPPWLKPSMTMEHAAAQCQQRGYTLKARLDPILGIAIIAIRPKREGDS